MRSSAPSSQATAVFSGYPECRESVGQDWVSWVEQGLLDMIMPMDYTETSLDSMTGPGAFWRRRSQTALALTYY